jgi:hypothetical protein
VTGGGVDIQDGGTFTGGTTHLNQVGGVRNDSASADCGEDKACASRLTAKRETHTPLETTLARNSETATSPLRIDNTGTTNPPIKYQGYTSSKGLG